MRALLCVLLFGASVRAEVLDTPTPTPTATASVATWADVLEGSRQSNIFIVFLCGMVIAGIALSNVEP